jgi:plasmid replication initiation protein
LICISSYRKLRLYELLESVANKDVPTMKADVEELRSWLKVPEGKLLRWQDFRRYVLEPAVKQINGNPEGAGFRVRMKIQKEGRAIKWVVFEVIKTKERGSATQVMLCPKCFTPTILIFNMLRSSTNPASITCVALPLLV